MRIKIILLYMLCISILFVISGCMSLQEDQVFPEALSKAQQEIIVLQERVSALELQMQSLNETVYQNRQYIKDLQGVYTYIVEEDESAAEVVPIPGP